MINMEGFILKEQLYGNVYCLSSEAIVLVISKEILENNFKNETFNFVINIVMKSLEKKYPKKEEIGDFQDEKDKDTWNIFKKHPGR